MKKLSVVLIVLGLLIASYPLIERAYSLYLESRLIMEWDVELDLADLSDEASTDYNQLQPIFEEGTEEADQADPDIDIEVTIDPSSGSDSSGEENNVSPLPTPDANQPDTTQAPQETQKPAATPKPLKAIGMLYIEKIDLKIPILAGATKANMRVGAGQISGTSKIGDIGNAALAAHRSHTYGRMFNRLDELEPGDKIIVETGDGKFEYTVYKKLVVEPDDMTVLNRNDKDKVLTLVTCTPLYTATHRLIVHAVIR